MTTKIFIVVEDINVAVARIDASTNVIVLSCVGRSVAVRNFKI